MYDSEEEKKFSTENSRHREGKNGEKAKTNAEYFKALEQWLNDVRSCQYCSFFPGFPYAMTGQQMSPPSVSLGFNSYVPPVPPVNQGFEMFTFPNEQQQPQTEEGVEYRIPPLWKRLLAETIDFIILFLFKLATLIIVDYFDIVDMEKFELFQHADKLNIQLALDVSLEIMSMEVSHRVFVCLYEVYHLQRSTNNQVGGATPGKVFLGIRVVFCNKVELVDNRPNIVKVTPATNLTFGWALGRALLKNFLVALLLPCRRRGQTHQGQIIPGLPGRSRRERTRRSHYSQL